MSVHYEVEGPIAVVTIDRPEVRNAIDGSTAKQLAESFQNFESDDALSVAVLTGADGTFCSGADLKAVSSDQNNLRVDLEGDGPLGCTRMSLSKPVIAAVEGHAVAGGLELALWADLRVAANDAVFGVYCRRWGVPLVDGGTIRLPRLIGQSHANDMILTGRGVSGQEAFNMGLANRLCSPGMALSEAQDLAQQLAEFPQLCLRSDRRSSYEQWGMSFEDALRNETVLGRETIESGETREGATRFAQGAGRHGDFSDI
ncbi:MAG: enoyl-CoA hydratase [Acidimicrobiaceae bacterium]|nr:enoyl-CoA hydratase [Acidimicrobiaceae bacterium]HAQ44446.1 crotonase/enoyl-CoA hydratase family protein [Acidimicrobiaceae bacterium]